MHFIKSFHAILFEGGREEGCNCNVFTLICVKLQDVRAAATATQILMSHVVIFQLQRSFAELAFFLHSSCMKGLLVCCSWWSPNLCKTDNGSQWDHYCATIMDGLLNGPTGHRHGGQGTVNICCQEVNQTTTNRPQRHTKQSERDGKWPQNTHKDLKDTKHYHKDTQNNHKET